MDEYGNTPHHVITLQDNKNTYINVFRKLANKYHRFNIHSNTYTTISKSYILSVKFPLSPSVVI